MKCLMFIFLFLFSYCYALNGQSTSYDTINFYNLHGFSISHDYSRDGKLISQEFTSSNSNLRKIHFYNSKQQIVREQIFENELMHEATFTYFEKGQVIKIYDVLNKAELHPRLRVNFDYPPLAMEYNIEGEVLVEFTLNEVCIPIQFNVHNSLGHGIDEEVNAKLKLMIQLSKKYHIPYKDCTEHRKPLAIWFSLNE